MNALRFGVLAGFFISGITGLVYQNIWIRMLTLVIGGTTAALTTVLIAFMGGLALGSYLLGGYADRSQNCLRAYAVVELAIGLYALLIPVVYGQVPELYAALHSLDPEHGLLFSALRFIMAVAFFGIPSTLMGGTLPLIVKALSGSLGSLQVTVARVYSVNTFGATVGAFLTGFVVIPNLGLHATLYVTAAVNFLLALGFWFVLGPKLTQVAETQPTSTEKPENSPQLQAEAVGSGAPRRKQLLLIFFFMGASSLSYEILWHRLLGLSFGSSVYAISTMLTAFLLGIALGSHWLKGRQAMDKANFATLANIELGIAGGGLLTAIILIQLPSVVQYLFLLPYVFTQSFGPGATDLGFWLMQVGLFAIATASMLLPTCLMGASFPVAIRLYADSNVGASVGKVYASNTFGSILGSFLTGFIFVETLGTKKALILWTVVNFALAAFLLFLQKRQDSSFRVSKQTRWAVAATVAFALLLGPAWNIDKLTSGVYYHVMGMERSGDRGKMVHMAEDDMGMVSLHRRKFVKEPVVSQVMKINGKFMANDGDRLTTLKLFSHAPVYWRGEGASEALVIGLGGGYTAQAALDHPFKNVDVVEISGAVVDMARIMNPVLFDDDRMNIYEEDARSFLLTGEKKYDVIISETSDPWMTGVANLYTEECFEWIKGRMAEDGVFGTWLQTRHKSVEDVQIILRTMKKVFPHMAALQFDEGDTVLLMSPSPLKLDGQFVQKRFSQIEQQMMDLNLTSPWSLPGALLLGEKSLTQYLGEGPINTDDMPVIEFSTPRTLNIGLKGQEVWSDMIAQAPDEPDMPALGLSEDEALLWKAHRFSRMSQDKKALTTLEQVDAPLEGYELLHKGQLLFHEGDWQGALELVESLPASPRQALLKAGVLTFRGDYGPLVDHLYHGEGWQVRQGRWEDRINHRRGLILRSLGLPVAEAAAH